MKQRTILLLLILSTTISCNLRKFRSQNSESENSKGLYLEYKAYRKGKSEQTDVLKVYSLDGNSLNELINLKKAANPIKTLTLKSEPGISYRLDEERKLYFKMRNTQLNEYEVTVIGKDSINNYHCTKIEVPNNSEGNYSILWITNEIPSYKKYLSAIVNNYNLGTLDKALKKKGIRGIPIRIEYPKTRGTSMRPDGYEDASLQYDLIKIEFKELNKSLFS